MIIIGKWIIAELINTDHVPKSGKLLYLLRRYLILILDIWNEDFDFISLIDLITKKRRPKNDPIKSPIIKPKDEDFIMVP